MAKLLSNREMAFVRLAASYRMKANDTGGDFESHVRFVCHETGCDIDEDDVAECCEESGGS